MTCNIFDEGVQKFRGIKFNLQLWLRGIYFQKFYTWYGLGVSLLGITYGLGYKSNSLSYPNLNLGMATGILKRQIWLRSTNPVWYDLGHNSQVYGTQMLLDFYTIVILLL